MSHHSHYDSREELDALQRRLQARRHQAAQFGYNADPVIGMEIEDIEKQIAQLEAGHKRSSIDVQNRHLLFIIPDNWSEEQRTYFLEKFIASILGPMRLKVSKRLKVSSNSISLLVEGEDQPRRILLEFDLQRDPVEPNTISTLFGNVTIRKAEAGWLFSISDLSKEAREQWSDIQKDDDLARFFTWFSPSRIIEVLIKQRSVIDPTSLNHYFKNITIGDWTLIATDDQQAWLVQLVEDGLPTKYSVFNALDGKPIKPSAAQDIANLSPRFNSLSIFLVEETSSLQKTTQKSRSLVARVISGDTWDDLRPSRPVDFVGRDDIIGDIAKFIGQVRSLQTSTRTFAIQGPSGWGKSSLILKLSDLVQKGKIEKCSFTAIDTRSAVNSAFVSESIRLAFLDAAKNDILPKSSFQIESLRDPLDSQDILNALLILQENNSCIVLIFDQFEELFTKEDLFETFTAIKELSLDIDAREIPLILGFAWKTDVSLPQLHPAYHLWHHLTDRRRSFSIREFGLRDVQKIVTKAEYALSKKLSSVLRARLVEQCQGYPWLLKKLLVHVLQRISTIESQYLLLERELDVEFLFKEDLSVLGDEEIRCLRYVAARAPIAVSDVEQNFSREATNFLINKHLLVKSGMNYAIYWDIFRDYLVDEKVPHIPWARTFQRGPTTPIKAFFNLKEIGPSTSYSLAQLLGLKERPGSNLMGDLIALQLVDSLPNDLYQPASHLSDLKPLTIAKHVQRQLTRHVVVRAIHEKWSKDKLMDFDEWYQFFANAHPRTAHFSKGTIHAYASNFRGWLLYAGILDIRNKRLFRPQGDGSLMGSLSLDKPVSGIFLGTAAPATFVRLLRRIYDLQEPIKRAILASEGFRNAILDGITLGILSTSRQGDVYFAERYDKFDEVIRYAKEQVLQQSTIKVVALAQDKSIYDATTIGRLVEQEIGANWKAVSAARYANGIRRYLRWARNENISEQPTLW